MMNDEETDIFQKLADPHFPIDELPWDVKVAALSKLVEARETYQKVVARLAASLPDDKPGMGSKKHIHKLAAAIEDATGRKMSVNTLHKYRQVYRAVAAFQEKIPLDWPFRAWVYLSREDEPGVWIDRAVAEGWSGAELVRELRISNPPEKRLKICRRCGSVQPDPVTCLSCGQPLNF